MLKIKPPNHHPDAPVVVTDMVLLDDLARTLCVAAGGRTDCEEFIGIDILAEPRQKGGDFFVMVPTSKDSTWKFDTHKTVKLKRSASILESMQASSEIRFSELH